MKSDIVIDEISMSAHKRQSVIKTLIYAAIPEESMVGDIVIALSDVLAYFVRDFSTDIYAGLQSYGGKMRGCKVKEEE